MPTNTNPRPLSYKDIMASPCPKCNAKSGDKCTGPSGEYASCWHWERSLAAGDGQTTWAVD